MSSKRNALVGTTVGLVVGLGLGVTGIANAVGGSPSPSPSKVQGGAPGDHRPGDHGPGGGFRGDHGSAFAGGLVTKVSSSSLTVQTPQGAKTYALTSSTTFNQGKTKATAAIVKVGEVVAVELVDPKATAPAAKSVTVVPAHLEGLVTKVDGSTVTITDESGFTRTLTTSSATTYMKDGTKATSAIVAVGAEVFALGAVDADGTTLDAASISIGRPAMGAFPGGPGGPGGFGPGRGPGGGRGFGPEGHGPQGTRPSPKPSGASG